MTNDQKLEQYLSAKENAQYILSYDPARLCLQLGLRVGIGEAKTAMPIDATYEDMIAWVDATLSFLERVDTL